MATNLQSWKKIDGRSKIVKGLWFPVTYLIVQCEHFQGHRFLAFETTLRFYRNLIIDPTTDWMFITNCLFFEFRLTMTSGQNLDLTVRIGKCNLANNQCKNARNKHSVSSVLKSLIVSWFIFASQNRAPKNKRANRQHTNTKSQVRNIVDKYFECRCTIDYAVWSHHELLPIIRSEDHVDTGSLTRRIPEDSVVKV